MTTLAIIPARGGSKGVSRKNIRQVGLVSLLGRVVRCAFASGVMDYVLVSTEDKEIQQEGLRYGASVPFLRPQNLATDHATMVDTLEHGIRAFEDHVGVKMDTIVLVEPTNPFRKPEKLREAVLLYQDTQVRSVISVCPLERKPENIFVKKENQTVVRFIEKPLVKFNRRQDMAHICRLSSVVYVVGRDDFMAEKKLILEPTGYIESSHIEAVNIDEELDLEFAEFLSNKYQI